MMAQPPSAHAPSFTISATDGKSRSGIINTLHGSIQTPATLMYTRRGNPQNLTPDMVARLQPAPQAFQLDAMQFLQHPAPEVLRQHGAGAHGYLGLDPGIPVVATQRDPTIYMYGVKPSTDAGAYVTIHSGGMLATPDLYMSAIHALQPDLWVTLCDEAPGDAKPKRAKQTVDRTAKWLDACLSWKPPAGAQQQPGDAAQGLAARALVAVAGAGSVAERARAAQLAAQRPAAGYALCGFGTGELLEERASLVQACMAHLPADKPRLMCGLTSPFEVLEAVVEGVDLFDDSYVVQATSLGYALSFPLQPPAGTSAMPEAAPTAELAGGMSVALGEQPGGVLEGSDGIKLNLWSPTYRHDRRPLLPGCQCHTCVRHVRAYIHHLLQANEMLAEVLLELHNTHHYQLFMASVREAVRKGELGAYVAWFAARVLGQRLEVHGPQDPPLANGGQGTPSKRWKPSPEAEAPPGGRPH